MPLTDFLRPNETILYQSPKSVDYQGQKYDFYVTNARLLWHNRKGLIFKKDNFVAAMKDYISAIAYKEKGIISKKAFIEIETTEGKKIEFSSSPPTIKAIYSEMQPYMPETEVLAKKLPNP